MEQVSASASSPTISDRILVTTTPTNEEVQLQLPTLRQGMNVQQWSVLGLQWATGAFAG